MVCLIFMSDLDVEISSTLVKLTINIHDVQVATVFWTCIIWLASTVIYM